MLSGPKPRIDYARNQEKTYDNVVELVIGNECVWGARIDSSDQEHLINYAKSKRAPNFKCIHSAHLPRANKWMSVGRSQ